MAWHYVCHGLYTTVYSRPYMLVKSLHQSVHGFFLCYWISPVIYWHVLLVSERKTLFCTCASLITIIWYIRWSRVICLSQIHSVAWNTMSKHWRFVNSKIDSVRTGTRRNLKWIMLFWGKSGAYWNSWACIIDPYIAFYVAVYSCFSVCVSAVLEQTSAEREEGLRWYPRFFAWGCASRTETWHNHGVYSLLSCLFNTVEKWSSSPMRNHLVGLVVEVPALRAEGPGFNSCLGHGDIPVT